LEIHSDSANLVAMIRAFYIFIFLLVGLTSCTETEIQTNETTHTAPIKITWEDLKFDSTSEVWSEEFATVMVIHHIKDKIKRLDGKNIAIRGFLNSIDDINKDYVISDRIYETAWDISNPETIIQVKIKPDSSLNLSHRILITGILQINEDDIFQLDYILKDAKIVNN
jgi:hypothetical protein